MFKNSVSQMALMSAGWKMIPTWRICRCGLEAFCAAIGFVWLMIEPATYFKPDLQGKLAPYWPYLIGFGIVWVIVRLGLLAHEHAPKLSACFRVDGSNTLLELMVGDLFQIDGALIIPSSITFDTDTNNQTISPQSIQGQFTRISYQSVDHLDSDLQSALSSRTPSRTVGMDEKPFGKRKEYPLGTCVRLDTGKTVAYFLALTKYNRDKTSQATMDELKIALEEMWKQIRSCGELEDLKTPVIGAARSRINESPENLIKEIVRSFTAAVSEGPFCKSLRIVVHPTDLERAQIKFENLIRFAESHACHR